MSETTEIYNDAVLRDVDTRIFYANTGVQSLVRCVKLLQTDLAVAARERDDLRALIRNMLDVLGIEQNMIEALDDPAGSGIRRYAVEAPRFRDCKRWLAALLPPEAR